MSNLSIIKQIIETAHQQGDLIKDALSNCFDICLQSLEKTFELVKELYDKDTWFITHAYRVGKLNDKIAEIRNTYQTLTLEAVEELNKRKKHCKDILMSMISELEMMINVNDIRKNLGDIYDTLCNIIENDPIFSVSRPNNILVLVWEFIRLSSPDFVSRIFRASTFQKKLQDLMNKINLESSNIFERLHTNLSKIAHYFNSFIHRLDSVTISDVENMTNIVWYNSEVSNDGNQCYIKVIEEKFAQYKVTQFDSEDHLTELIESNSQHNIILIISGRIAGIIANTIGYHWSLKGIIIFSTDCQYRQQWPKQYRKVMLVTNVFSDVIDKIQNLLDNNSYSTVRGFKHEEIFSNLPKNSNPYYYISSEPNEGFIISNFSESYGDQEFYKDIMVRLYDRIKRKKIFNDSKGELLMHFKFSNLQSIALEFADAFHTNTSEPIEKKIIRLYSNPQFHFDRVVNDILNLLDEDLILLLGQYIKTLRYSLIIYHDDDDDDDDNTLYMTNMKEFKVYRGIHMDRISRRDFVDKFKIHDHIIFPSFLSTSLNQDVALLFCDTEGVILEITINLKGIDNRNIPKCIKNVSKIPDEDEILLNCFSMLKIDMITETENVCRYHCTLVSNW